MKRLNILAEVYPKELGRVIYRINKYLKLLAPSYVNFVKEPSQADLQILDVIGQGSLKFKYNNNIIYLQHCYLTAETTSQDYWLPLFKESKLVVTYMNLPKLTGSSDFSFLRLPWGVDPSVFFNTMKPKKYMALTTGYVASTESIQEVYDSVSKINQKLVHVGGNLKLGYYCDHFENISDEKLNELYNNSMFVCGLRKGEGFELPIIEGLMCGARGICFNADHYRFWYEDLVEYIEEGKSFEESYSQSIVDQLDNLFSKAYRPVSLSEISLVKEKFSWKNIFSTFWKRVEECM